MTDMRLGVEYLWFFSEVKEDMNDFCYAHGGGRRMEGVSPDQEGFVNIPLFVKDEGMMFAARTLAIRR